MIHNNIFKLFWFATAGFMLIIPPTINHIVVLGLTSTIIVVQEWLNMIKVNDEMIEAWKKFHASVNLSVSSATEEINELTTMTRINTESINTRAEEIKRLQTTANFKEIN